MTTTDRRQIYIGGAWTRPVGGDMIEVENPFTEEVIGQVPRGGAEDVDRAVTAAAEAFPEWSRTTPAERAGHLRRLHAALAARSDEIARTITAEMGAPIRIATRVQAALPLTVVSGIADLLEDFPFEERIGNSLVVKEPIGVVGAITPWNYPLHQITAKIAPALAAGCTVVVKPSEVAPLAACLLFDAIDEAGLPDGVVNLVPGYGPEVGEALAAHPRVDMMSFTGSTRAGRRVAEVAAGTIKKVSLELGGKSANVLLPDADLGLAVKAGVGNAFLNGGQTCTAWTRMLAPAERHDEIVEMAAAIAEGFSPGDPLDPKTKLGPMVSAAQRDRVRGFIETGAAEGARVVTGGSAAPEGLDRGYFVRPTVLAEVDPDATVAQEEIFGPVLSIIRYRDEAEALEIANNSRYGLAGAVWSADQERAVAFARRIRTGQVDVNGGAYNPMAPFGGFRQSGIGREMGAYGIEEFLQPKSIQL